MAATAARLVRIGNDSLRLDWRHHSADCHHLAAGLIGLMTVGIVYPWLAVRFAECELLSQGLELAEDQLMSSRFAFTIAVVASVGACDPAICC